MTTNWLIARAPSRLSPLEAAERIAGHALRAARRVRSAGQDDPAITRDRLTESATALGFQVGRDYLLREVVEVVRRLAGPDERDLIAGL